MIIQTDVLGGILALTMLFMMLVSPFFYERDWEDEMEQRRRPKQLGLEPMAKYKYDGLAHGWGSEISTRVGSPAYLRASGLSEA